MAPTPYFSSVISESAFKARFQAENGVNFCQLPNASASYWGRLHLLACRVIRREPQRRLLPILSDYAKSSDLHPESMEIRAFLEGPTATQMAQREHSLVRKSDCGITLAQTWAAMAMFKGSTDRHTADIPSTPERNEIGNVNEDELRQSKRLKRDTFQPDFQDSSGMRVGSSSPPQEGFYNGSPDGSKVSSIGYIDSDAHFASMTVEDDTLRLASCVIRHILYFAPPQDSPSLPVVVEFRDAKSRIAATTPAERKQIIAIDDGGLCLRQKKPYGGVVLAKKHVALVEAKTQFQCLEEGRPIISDRNLAQMVCEALATRLSNRPDRVIVINATQHYMCFLQMDISDDYLLDFEVTTPRHMLYVSSTPWFDISQRSGRESILANLCGIMRRAMSLAGAPSSE
ncbi:hypothetical protein P168DRAFT_275162 [Aspergillus campestris IBT 28561]|uniref:Uncharacterized protein n=1 Tax=Aspergillus campestris (strain IBT 28561) TaxID=1392248 RepID=A0A2I1CSY5_ASPC2|nr:uncharacterized protein P168DRAFT_275162 [Aspergillus campestris IBT 28561]PKY00727.1 hypothetical protein P168DRAFT_275162 [Aspergillus campestris IBT 28561]